MAIQMVRHGDRCQKLLTPVLSFAIHCHERQNDCVRVEKCVCVLKREKMSAVIGKRRAVRLKMVKIVWMKLHSIHIAVSFRLPIFHWKSIFNCAFVFVDVIWKLSTVKIRKLTEEEGRFEHEQNCERCSFHPSFLTHKISNHNRSFY